jgi:hypothetical protein
MEVAYTLDMSLNIGIRQWSRMLFEKLIVAQRDRKLLGFHSIRMFITDLTRAFHLTFSWASWNEFTTSHRIYLIPIFVLPIQLNLDLISFCILSSEMWRQSLVEIILENFTFLVHRHENLDVTLRTSFFQIKIGYAFSMHAACRAHPPWLYDSNNI